MKHRILGRFLGTFAVTTKLLIATSPLAQANMDVFPSADKLPGTKYVKVTLSNSKTHANFQECVIDSVGASGKIKDLTCRGMGRKPWYSIRELQSERASYYWSSGLRSAGVVGTAVVAAGVIYFAGSAFLLVDGIFSTLLGVGTTYSGTALAATSLGGAALVGTATTFALSPYHHYQYGQAVRDGVIQDQNTIAQEIDSFIKNLEHVLDQI